MRRLVAVPKQGRATPSGRVAVSTRPLTATPCGDTSSALTSCQGAGGLSEERIRHRAAQYGGPLKNHQFSFGSRLPCERLSFQHAQTLPQVQTRVRHIGVAFNSALRLCTLPAPAVPPHYKTHEG